MEKINDDKTLEQRTFSPEKSCCAVAPFFINTPSLFSSGNGTAMSGTIVFGIQKFFSDGRIRPRSCGGQKGARKL